MAKKKTTKKDTLTVTISGDPQALIEALIGGLPPEALQQMADQIAACIETRKKKGGK